MFTHISLPRAPHIVRAAAITAAALLLSFQATNANSAEDAAKMPGMAMPRQVGEAAKNENFTFGEPGKPSKVDRSVEITMRDISFEPSSLDVTLNETVRFVITNKGELDHEFVLGDVEEQTAHRKEMVEMSEKGQDMHEGEDPNAIGVKAGKTQELIWKFTRAGDFEFDCNVPGHFEAGMTGPIHVRAKKQQR